MSKLHPIGRAVPMQGTQVALGTDCAIRTTPLLGAPPGPPEQVGCTIVAVVSLAHAPVLPATTAASRGTARARLTTGAPGRCRAAAPARGTVRGGSPR